MENQIKVKKRNGSLEDFDEAKIARVVTAAGLTADEGRQLATNVGEWIKMQGKNPVSSLEIRNNVLEKLKKVNNYAANLYQWYEKTKE